MRRIFSCIALLGLMGACNESVYFSSTEKSSAEDAAVQPGIDASGPINDASSDAGPDLLACEGDCLGDVGVQLTACETAIWTTSLDTDGRQFSPLGASSGVCESGDSKIIPCRGGDQSECVDENSIIMKPSASGPVATGLSVLDQVSARITVSVQRLEAGSATELRIFRNTRDDLLHAQRLSSEESSLSIEIDAELIEDDRIWLSIEQEGDTGSNHQASFRVVDRGGFPGTCQLALKFLDNTVTTASDLCEGRSYERKDRNRADLPIEMADFLSELPVKGLGDALRFPYGSYLDPDGGSVSGAGDFTIQLWMRHFAWEGSQDFGYPFTTRDIDTNLGFWLFYNRLAADDIEFYLSAHDPAGGISFAQAAFPDDMSWHFIRAVRDTQASEFRICIDGVLAARGVADGAIDFSSGLPPAVGSIPLTASGFKNFQADVADLRFMTKLLPCE